MPSRVPTFFVARSASSSFLCQSQFRSDDAVTIVLITGTRFCLGTFMSRFFVHRILLVDLTRLTYPDMYPCAGYYYGTGTGPVSGSIVDSGTIFFIKRYRGTWVSTSTSRYHGRQPARQLNEGTVPYSPC
eukprot:SAG11_NODE_13304_length_661_cov_0.870107_1_plen_129_part_01